MKKNIARKTTKPARDAQKPAAPDYSALGEWYGTVHVPSIRERVSRIHRMAGLAHVALLGRRLPFVDDSDLEDWIENYLSEISTEAFWILSNGSSDSLGSPAPDDDDNRAVELGASVGIEESRVTQRMWREDHEAAGPGGER